MGAMEPPRVLTTRKLLQQNPAARPPATVNAPLQTIPVREDCIDENFKLYPFMNLICIHSFIHSVFTQTNIDPYIQEI